MAMVRSAEAVAPSVAELRVESAALAAKPGQFVMVRCGDGLDPFLPRPFSIAGQAATPDGRTLITLLVYARGPGSTWLAARRPGDAIVLTGPLGRPIQLHPGARHLLLIAEGAYVAPLLFLADAALAADLSVAFILVAGDQPVYPPERFPVAAEAFVIDAAAARNELTEHLRWADQIAVSGSESLLRMVAAAMRRSLVRAPALALPWAPLPCGTGICAACGIELRRGGTRLLCRDGPSFTLTELY